MFELQISLIHVKQYSADTKDLQSNSKNPEYSKNVEQSSDTHQEVTIVKARTKEPNATIRAEGAPKSPGTSRPYFGDLKEQCFKGF